ncbi:MAG: M20 family metallopeptidase [Lachnospiraceae bacterium]
MEYIENAKIIENQIIKDRRVIHQNPEFGMELPQTVAFVKGRLESMGYEVTSCGGGLVTTVGNGGKVILLRADMDALESCEENNCTFKSQNKFAHLCGHDMHTAMLLGVAKLLKDNEKNLMGTVKMMFQPGEEVAKGAKAMIAAGVLNNPKVDVALALHVTTCYANGKMFYKSGAAFSSVDLFTIEATGKGGHGSAVESTKDPINALVQIYNQLNGIITREVSMFNFSTCSVGQIEAGKMPNVIPQNGVMKGTLRCYDDNDRDRLISRLKSIVDGVSKGTEVKCDLKLVSLPSLKNDKELCNELTKYLSEIEGLEFFEETIPATGSEDFAAISQIVPTMFIWFGVGEDGGVTLHSPNAIFHEDKMYLGSAAMANAATKWLEEKHE